MRVFGYLQGKQPFPCLHDLKSSGVEPPVSQVAGAKKISKDFHLI